MGITIKDIAKALNLSVSTISKALHGSHEISPPTRQRVMDYAKANNYRPNRLATGLKKGQSNTIGVIICSHFSSIFAAQVLDGIHEACFETGYDIIIMQSLENVEKEKACLEAMIDKGVDGILIAPVSETSNADYLNYIIDNHCPVIVYDRINPAIKTIRLGVNEYKGALEATQHLININRKRILFITGDKFGENNQRTQGFKKAMKNLDIPLNERYMLYCNLEDVTALDAKIKETILSLAEQNIKPNAIFGATDVITTRTLGILSKMKIRVPEEIAVIGFANTDIVESLNPPLSAIRQPAKEMGYTALTKLAGLIHDYGKKPVKPDETLLLDTSIQLRESTGITA